MDKTFGNLIDENYTAEDFSGNLGELLATDVASDIPDNIRVFLQGVYKLACDVIDS